MSTKSSSGSCSSREPCTIPPARDIKSSQRTSGVYLMRDRDCTGIRVDCGNTRTNCGGIRVDCANTRLDCGGVKMDCCNTNVDCGGYNDMADLLVDNINDSQMTESHPQDLDPTDSNTSTLIPDPFPLDMSCRELVPSMDSLGYYDDQWNGNYEVLYDWIDRMEIVKIQKNVHRDFSDAVLMAELLKKLYPKMVDLHNYSPANSFNNKLSNWTTLNNKVLKKLKLSQSQKTLQDLARAEPGVLETLLSKVKQKYENSKIKQNPTESVNNEDLSTNVIVLNGQKINKDQYKTMVSKCDTLQDQLAESDEVIKILKNKVSHLEELLEIKDEIIRNLKAELSNFKAVTTTDILTTVSELSSLCRSPADRNMTASSCGAATSCISGLSAADSFNPC